VKKAALVRVQAFQCSACGRIQEADPPKWTTIAKLPKDSIERKQYRAQAQLRAEQCCTCPNCKEKCDRYIGATDKLCSKCKRRAVLASSAENTMRAITQYEQVCLEYDVHDDVIDSALCRIVDIILERRKKKR
jgi:hypothetical protein